MEDPVKMRDMFIPRPIQFIDEGYSEMDNESTMSLDLNAVDYQLEDHQMYADEDDAYSWSDDECNDSSVELDSITSPYSPEKAERLEIMHLMFTMAVDGYLHLAPINRHPQRILDIGCGTGIWCIEMADAYPSAEVIGVELSPSQPILVPPNLTFQIDEFDDEWTFSHSFDYIHARLLAGRIRDWPRLVRQCFQNCNPCGWVEFQEIDPLLTHQHESLSQSSASKGEVTYPGSFLAQRMHEAGFVNIQVSKRNQPMTFRKDAKLQVNLLSEKQSHEELSTSAQMYSDTVRCHQDQGDPFKYDSMSDETYASTVTIDLYTFYGQKP